MKTSEQPVIIKQIFDTSVENIWSAITDLDEMKHWYFNNIPDFKTKVGFTTQFNVDAGERDFMHLWKIVEVIEYQKISYEWRFEKYDGIGLVSFELFEQNNQTTLILTNSVIEDFSDTVPEFKRERCLGGWKYFINQNLNDYIQKKYSK